jgi:hypothetical protein
MVTTVSDMVFSLGWFDSLLAEIDFFRERFVEDVHNGKKKNKKNPLFEEWI